VSVKRRGRDGRFAAGMPPPPHAPGAASADFRAYRRPLGAYQDAAEGCGVVCASPPRSHQAPLHAPSGSRQELEGGIEAAGGTDEPQDDGPAQPQSVTGPMAGGRGRYERHGGREQPARLVRVEAAGGR
jgi:hypothetical protein